MRMHRLFGFSAALGLTFYATALGLGLFTTNTHADERVSIGLAYIDNGSCGDPVYVADAEYVRTGGDLEARAEVNTGPSGGDCRQAFTNYDINLERTVAEIGAGWSAIFKLGADRNAFTSAYAQVVNGQVDLRPDGQASFPVNLPAGVATNAIGAIALSRAVGFGEIDLGYNVVPVDFADGSSERTVHLGYDAEVGPVEFGVSFDTNSNNSFGDAYAVWSHGLAEVKLAYQWGLNSLFDGAPATQQVNGAQFTSVGQPDDDTFTASFRVRLNI